MIATDIKYGYIVVEDPLYMYINIREVFQNNDTYIVVPKQ